MVVMAEEISLIIIGENINQLCFFLLSSSVKVITLLLLDNIEDLFLF